MLQHFSTQTILGVSSFLRSLWREVPLLQPVLLRQRGENYQSGVPLVQKEAEVLPRQVSQPPFL